MTAPDILVLAVLIVVLGISMIAVIEVKRRHLPVLSLIVRVLYWIARWFKAVAIASDRGLLEYRDHRHGIPLSPLNEEYLRLKAPQTPVNAEQQEDKRD